MSAREIVGLIGILMVAPFVIIWTIIIIGAVVLALADWLVQVVAWFEMSEWKYRR